MAVRSQRNIYGLLEKHLVAAHSAMTVTALMDIPEIRAETLKEFADSKNDQASVVKATNKLSDILGFMWRRNLLTRYPAPKETSSFARFAYIWEKKEDAHPISDTALARAPSGKTSFTIKEVEDGVQLEFQKFTVTIKAK